MLAYINYPSWITPEVFGFLNLPEGHFLNMIKWYGLMYIVAITISYFQCMHLLKKEKFKTLNKKIIDDYYFWAVIGLVIGARVIFCLVYDFDYYIRNIFEILIPIRGGKFVGFQGMSFHGGALGIFIASVLYSKFKKIDFIELCDLIFPTIPLGYTFGRIANFINGELYGRVTSSPIAIFFPQAEKVPVKFDEVGNIIDKIGWNIDKELNTVTDSAGKVIENALDTKMVNGIEELFINLPRFPSQLFEAFFEGIVLFIIVWFIARRFSPYKGFVASIYLIGYSIFRFIIEFFRQPDSQFADIDKGNYHGFIIGNISMGQILSVIMIICAIIIGVFFYKKNMEVKNNKQRRKKG